MRRLRKAEARDDDTTTYLLRNVPGDLWRQARVRAIVEQRDMSEVLRAFIRAYGAERIDVPREQATSKQRQKLGRR
jgi:plasmid stability protein